MQIVAYPVEMFRVFRGANERQRNKEKKDREREKTSVDMTPK